MGHLITFDSSQCQIPTLALGGGGSIDWCIMTAYSEVTREPYACILLDNKPDTPADKQVLYDIFGSCRAYVNINSTSASIERKQTGPENWYKIPKELNL